MSLFSLNRELLKKEQETIQQLPETCQDCVNLHKFSIGPATLALSCEIEIFRGAMISVGDTKDRAAKPGATAEWVGKAIRNHNFRGTALNELEDGDALKLRVLIDRAPEECPLVKNVMQQLFKASHRQIIKFDLPEPMMDYETLTTAKEVSLNH